MRGNTRRVLVALVLAASIGTGGLAATSASATSVSAASDGSGSRHGVGSGVVIPGIDPGKDCPVTTAWGDANCPPRQY